MARIDTPNYRTQSIDRAPLRVAPSWHALLISAVAWIGIATLVVGLLAVVEAALPMGCVTHGTSPDCTADFANRSTQAPGAGGGNLTVPQVAQRF